MVWQYGSSGRFLFRTLNRHMEPFKTNEKCFIRKEHKCGKIFGASKSCFIACPTDDNIEPILEIMSEKLAKAKIEPIIAVKERAYGQDIFCTKICGKIIESQFCIVILDDTIKDSNSIPNPNVYYEYGLMTALRKHIIPLQNDDLDLAFNIQSYDTIKYKPANIGSELDRAIKDAIKITESQETEDKSPLSDKTILRRLELNGFKSKEDWILSDIINDTNFNGFSDDENNISLYLGKVDSEDELTDYLEDLGVVLYRTENFLKDLKNEKKEYENKKEELELRAKSGEREAIRVKRELESITRRINNVKKTLKITSKIVVGFIISPHIDTEQFREKANSIIDEYDRYELVFNSGDEIEIKDNIISLTPNY